MRTFRVARSGATIGLAALACSAAGAQSAVERGVAAVADGTVQFHFASRAGVCGNGRTFFRVDDDGWFQTSTGNVTWSGAGIPADLACARGPVRVVITKAGGEPVRIETNVGPLASVPEDGTDLGEIPPREAAQYLLAVAANAAGRPAREAITPATLAENAPVAAALLAIARDRERPRDVRRSALSWASRRRDEPGGPGAAAVVRALNAIVRDREESESIRQHALSTIASFNRGEGIPALIGFASDNDQWVAQQAIRTLARSGDPRARAFTRDVVKRDDLPDDVRSEVIRGLGGDYATGADYRLLRDLYPRLNADRDRDAVISVLANAGGRDNTDWLLALARSPTESVGRRRRVIAALAKLDDPRVAAALKDLVIR
jgi:hypothetical protein